MLLKLLTFSGWLIWSAGLSHHQVSHTVALRLGLVFISGTIRHIRYHVPGLYCNLSTDNNVVSQPGLRLCSAKVHLQKLKKFSIQSQGMEFF